LRGRGQRSSPIEEDDEIDDDRRRFMTPGLERLQDLFREDSVDSMDVDLNLGTFDNGRRDNIVRWISSILLSILLRLDEH
jgi:hypothetical protein